MLGMKFAFQNHCSDDYIEAYFKIAVNFGGILMVAH